MIVALSEYEKGREKMALLKTRFCFIVVIGMAFALGVSGMGYRCQLPIPRLATGRMQQPNWKSASLQKTKNPSRMPW